MNWFSKPVLDLKEESNDWTLLWLKCFHLNAFAQILKQRERVSVTERFLFAVTRPK